MAEEGYRCWVITWHPCNYLIEQILNVVACCLGLCDSFCHPREPYDHQEQEHEHEQGTDGTNEPATGDGDDPPTTMAAARRRPRQQVPSEGRGGQHN